MADADNPHLVHGKFQSDKYPTCPPDKVPLSVKDPLAQDLLWVYAQRRRTVGPDFSDAVERRVLENGFLPHAPQPIETAPRNGSMLRLLVDYADAENGHPLEDAAVAWTIGFNNFDHDGEDVWKFAGWCWTHDHFTEGDGRPTHWLPMPPTPQIGG